MRGWFADLFRLPWALIYWNVRKAWFRWRRGRASCPCQSPSDSGRAYETQCEACVSWSRPARFRRVCPLLVATPNGLRCAADTAEVRPFWGRAGLFFGGTALVCYAVLVVIAFGFLRTVGYPISIVDVAVPVRWQKLQEARSWYFENRAEKAFEAGNTVEGLLYLSNAFDFDPANYRVGLKLAKNYQAGQPIQSDEIFSRLLRDHPDKREATAQEWFRALLARGDFPRIATLAQEQILAGSPRAAVWMRALLFASARDTSEGPFAAILNHQTPAAKSWHRLLEVETLRRRGRLAESRAALESAWAPGSPAFTVFYRVDTLIRMNRAAAALDILAAHAGQLDGDTTARLRLDAFASAGAAQSREREFNELLARPLTPPMIVLLCTHLIRHPHADYFDRLCRKLKREPLLLTNDTAGVWFSLLCTAGAVGDKARLHEFTVGLRGASKTPFVALGLVEAFFRGETLEQRLTTFLPILPLPLEVTYALLERYSQPPPKRGD